MKASPILLSSFLGALCLVTLDAKASPRAAEAAGSHYLLAADGLEGWHLGGYYRYADREVNHNSGIALKQNKYMMHLGHDLLSWLSVYGMLGVVTAKVDPIGNSDSDTAAEYGLGVWANLIDHDLLNNLTMETRLRLQALAQFSMASPDINGRSNDYREFYGTLTLSVVNEIIGNKNYWPNAIGLFFGPVYNDIKLDKEDIYKPTGGEVGFTVGFDVYLTRDTTLSLGYEAYEEDKALNAALNFRF